MNKEAERRAYSFEIRAEETENGSIITGRPIVYNSMTDIGYFNEIIETGALNNADLKDVRFLVNHDTSRIPLARSRRNNGNSTMLLAVDDAGMNIRVSLDTENNAEARSLYSAVKRGDITGMSFMFTVDGEEWDNLDSDHPTRRIKSIANVIEVSAVTFPAYEATDIQARSKTALDNARSMVDTVRQQTADTVDTVTETRDEDVEVLKLKTQTILLGGM